VEEEEEEKFTGTIYMYICIRRVARRARRGSGREGKIQAREGGTGDGVAARACREIAGFLG